MDHYYHGSINATKAASRLLREGGSPTGRFLLRKSTIKSQYIVSYVKNDGNVAHIKLPTRRDNNLFVDNQHLLHAPVDELINFISDHFDYQLIHPVASAAADDEDNEEEEDQEERPDLQACHVCDKHVPNLSNHMAHHNITYCHVCEKIIISSKFNDHKEACLYKTFHFNEQQHQCPHCEFKTPYPKNLKRHASTQHPGGGGIHFCDKCDKRFSSAHRLENHVAQEHNSGRFKCTSCPKSFSLRRNLAFHVKKCHANAANGAPPSPPRRGSPAPLRGGARRPMGRNRPPAVSGFPHFFRFLFTALCVPAPDGCHEHHAQAHSLPPAAVPERDLGTHQPHGAEQCAGEARCPGHGPSP